MWLSLQNRFLKELCTLEEIYQVQPHCCAPDSPLFPLLFITLQTFSVVLTAELLWTAFTVLCSLLAPSHRHESKTNPPSGSSSLLICLPALHPWRCSLQRNLSHHVDNPKWRLILRLISFHSRFHAPFILLDGDFYLFIFFSSSSSCLQKRLR